MPVKTPMRFVGQVDEYGFQPDLGRLSVVVEIAPAMKIMLVHHRPPVQPLRSYDQVQRLADRGFADVIAAYQQGVTRKSTTPFRTPRKFQILRRRTCMTSGLAR